MFYRYFPQFTVEYYHKFSPNIVRFQLTLGGMWWYIVGCYLALDDTSTIERIFAAISQNPCRTELLVAGYLNVDLVGPEGNSQDKGIAAALAAVRLEGTPDIFLPYQNSWARYGRTWSMTRMEDMKKGTTV